MTSSLNTNLPPHASLPHASTAESVAEHFMVCPEGGLDREEVQRRLTQHGPNAFREAKPRSPWVAFARQFKNALVLILLLAAVLAAIVGNYKDAIVVCAVVLLNALVAFFQEHRAERSLAALKRMLPLRARVRRAGDKTEVPAEELVPGDIILIEAGDRVPADGRLFVTIGLLIDESSLTGESEAVAKDSSLVTALDAPLGNRRNMAFMNTIVTRGRGEFIVTATGPRTAMGRISEQLASTESRPSPLQVQLDGLGKRLGAISLVLVGVLFLIQMLRGASLTREIMDAIALAVASVPEGLPVVVTVTLALGMRHMATRGAIVRNMASVETLGCTTVICSDKTGTLTLNQMTVRSLYSSGQTYVVTGEGYRTDGIVQLETGGNATVPDPTLLASSLIECNDSRVTDGVVIGDAMEGALIVLAQKLLGPQVSTKTSIRVAEIPFDSAHKFMATFHDEGDRVRVWVKGAPDVLLSRCSRWFGPEGEPAFTGQERSSIEAAYGALSGRGLRGLLMATRTVPRAAFNPSGNQFELIQDLLFLGLLGLQDPPRPEVKQAVARCKEAAIQVKMITGDHPETALAIARELGITGDLLAGGQLEAMTDQELAKAVQAVGIFARVAPEHKVRIVKALQGNGHVVAMTGDGVNDAPALKRADIGVAMGLTGTDVSKEAASMILTDDNFATIVSAVQNGRALYDNIVKFVRFQLSTSMGAVLTVFFAPLLNLPDPFNAIQILWVAIIMDGPPAISLALDQPRPGIMHEPPRKRSEPILPISRITRVFWFGLAMMIGTLAVLRYGMGNGTESRALTLGFTTFVLFQFFNVFNARAENGTAFNRGFLANRMLWFSLLGGVLLQILAVHWPPAQAVFRTTALSASDWTLATGVASLILLGEEARKLLGRLFARRRGAGSLGFVFLATALATSMNAAELQSQHALDTSFNSGKWSVVLHSRARVRVENFDLFQFRAGPIVEYSLTSRASLLGGYYFARNDGASRKWSTTHRPFAGVEFAISKRRLILDSRSLIERFYVPGTGDFNRYRQRLWVTRSAPAGGPYGNVEYLFDAAGLRSVRYGAGWRIGPHGAFLIDFGYFYETRRTTDGGNRQMLITTVHVKRQNKRIDPDP
jgi:Ca2+-transporting ATPase